MTVGELRERMSNDEFVHWAQYHALQAQQMELEQKRARGEGRATSD